MSTQSHPHNHPDLHTLAHRRAHALQREAMAQAWAAVGRQLGRWWRLVAQRRRPAAALTLNQEPPCPTCTSA